MLSNLVKSIYEYGDYGYNSPIGNYYDKLFCKYLAMVNDDNLKYFEIEICWTELLNNLHFYVDDNAYSDTYKDILKKYDKIIDIGTLHTGKFKTCLLDYFVTTYSDQLDWSTIKCHNISDDVFKLIIDKIDWNKIPYQNLGENFLVKYIDKIDWNKISYQNLSENFLVKYIDKINTNGLRFSKLSDEFMIKYHKYININDVYCNISENVLGEYIDEYKWHSWGDRIVLSEDFIDKYANKINWKYIDYKNLSVKILHKYSDKLDWCNFRYTNLDDSFVNKYSDKLNWERLFKEYPLTQKMFLKHKHKFYENCYDKDLNCDKFSEQFIENTLMKMKMDKRCQKRYLDNLFKRISEKRPGLSEKFIIKYKNKLNWISLDYSNLSDKFVNANKNIICWHHVAKSATLSRKTIMNNFMKFGMNKLGLKNIAKLDQKYIDMLDCFKLHRMNYLPKDLWFIVLSYSEH